MNIYQIDLKIYTKHNDDLKTEYKKLSNLEYISGWKINSLKSVPHCNYINLSLSKNNNMCLCVINFIYSKYVSNISNFMNEIENKLKSL